MLFPAYLNFFRIAKTARSWKRIIFLSAMMFLVPGTSLAEDEKSLPSNPQMQLVLGKDYLSIGSGNKPILRYHYRQVPNKPYVAELFTPEGINILQDSPPDHSHHHGLMYALTIDGINFWEEKNKETSGIEKHQEFVNSFLDENESRSTAGFTERLDWSHPQTQNALITENRTIQVNCLKEEEATQITWTSRLTTAPGVETATLTGTVYHGLGIRFLKAMDKKGTFFCGAPGQIHHGDERLKEANWSAFTAAADGKAITVAMFNHPANPVQPAIWFAIDQRYNYLSATLGLYEKPIVLTPKDALTVCYGIMVWDGNIGSEAVEKACHAWIASTSDMDSGH